MGVSFIGEWLMQHELSKWLPRSAISPFRVTGYCLFAPCVRASSQQGAAHDNWRLHQTHYSFAVTAKEYCVCKTVLEDGKGGAQGIAHLLCRRSSSSNNTSTHAN